jgi:hypothetical protein
MCAGRGPCPEPEPLSAARRSGASRGRQTPGALSSRAMTNRASVSSAVQGGGKRGPGAIVPVAGVMAVASKERFGPSEA